LLTLSRFVGSSLLWEKDGGEVSGFNQLETIASPVIAHNASFPVSSERRDETKVLKLVVRRSLFINRAESVSIVGAFEDRDRRSCFANNGWRIKDIQEKCCRYFSPNAGIYLSELHGSCEVGHCLSKKY